MPLVEHAYDPGCPNVPDPRDAWATALPLWCLPGSKPSRTIEGSKHTPCHRDVVTQLHHGTRRAA
jgi:hypothetical protein